MAHFRSSYTSQIMDILNNVSKQKNETKKVIEEIRTVQKDINMQEGKLSRTYADTDHLLFEVNLQLFRISMVFSEIVKNINSIMLKRVKYFGTRASIRKPCRILA